MDTSKEATQQLAKMYANQGQPDGWFEAFYARAEGDISKIYWADLEPNPLLLAWTQKNPPSAAMQAVTVGCGLGDDAEALARTGYHVTAFDISTSAIAMCRQRYPDSKVTYSVADLFALPQKWHQTFGLVYECNTIQILTGSNRIQAIEGIANLVAPGGHALVSCRSRDIETEAEAFPLPLDKKEISGFVRAGLTEIAFTAYDDQQTPAVPHFFAVYRRPV